MWGHTKTTVIIVTIVIFADSATEKPRSTRLPCCILTYLLF